MVKGLTYDLDKILFMDNIPYMIETHLLMFEKNIIYSSIIKSYAVSISNEQKNMILKETNDAIKYYHL